jgi:hypothetical protein
MSSTKRAKRKLSDLTSKETNDVVSLLKSLGDFDEDEEDELSVIESVKNIIRKLEKTKVCSHPTCCLDIIIYNQRKHLPFSEVSVTSLANAHINVLPMKWTPHWSRRLGCSGMWRTDDPWRGNFSRYEEKTQKYSTLCINRGLCNLSVLSLFRCTILNQH